MDPLVSYSGASTIIIYVIRVCGLFSNVSMLVSIGIVFMDHRFAFLIL
jgi:hypothetical protein